MGGVYFFTLLGVVEHLKYARISFLEYSLTVSALVPVRRPNLQRLGLAVFERTPHSVVSSGRRVATSGLPTLWHNRRIPPFVQATFHSPFVAPLVGRLALLWKSMF